MQERLDVRDWSVVEMVTVMSRESGRTMGLELVDPDTGRCILADVMCGCGCEPGPGEIDMR